MTLRTLATSRPFAGSGTGSVGRENGGHEATPSSSPRPRCQALPVSLPSGPGSGAHAADGRTHYCPDHLRAGFRAGALVGRRGGCRGRSFRTDASLLPARRWDGGHGGGRVGRPLRLSAVCRTVTVRARRYQPHRVGALRGTRAGARRRRARGAFGELQRHGESPRGGRETKDGGDLRRLPRAAHPPVHHPGLHGGSGRGGGRAYGGDLDAPIRGVRTLGASCGRSPAIVTG